MKVTRGELKQIINEELEAQILRENIISDLVDKIKDSGEDAWSWIKDNAEVVRDKAEDAGIAVKDLVDDVVYKVDQVAGTEMSKQAKWDAADLEKEKAKNRAAIRKRSADREWSEPENVRARALAAQEKEHGEWKKQKRKQADIDWNLKQRAADNKKKKGDEDDDGETWAQERARKSGRVNPGAAGSGNMGYGESVNRKGNTNMKITRSELKKIIKEELAKVLSEERPADQKKPWGGRTSHQNKPLRWGGHDIAPEKPAQQSKPTQELGWRRDAKRWAQAVSESEYLDQKAFANWDARGLAADIRQNGFEEMPDEVRLSPAVQRKYEYYFQKDTGNLPECEGTGKCGAFGKTE
jgi:hypothetical protein